MATTVTHPTLSVTQYDRLLYALDIWAHVAQAKSPEALAPRISRAVAIVRQEQVRPEGDHYRVMAQCHSGHEYTVTQHANRPWSCNCMDQFRPCKHILAVRAYRKANCLLAEQWIAEWYASAHTELGIATKVWTPDHTDFEWVFQSPTHRQPCLVHLHDLVLCGALALLAGAAAQATA